MWHVYCTEQGYEAKQSKVLDPPVRDRAPETRIVPVSGIVDGRQVSFPLTVTVSPTFNFGGLERGAARALGATRVKSRVSRAIGIPLTASGRQVGRS
jgi:hypothetical protein